MWGRRRSDKRNTKSVGVERQSYAPIQLAPEPLASDVDTDELAIPSPNTRRIEASVASGADAADTTTSDTSPAQTPASDTLTSSGPRVFAFMGATGGVGTTSLCTQFAYELATRNKAARPSRNYVAEPTVCLIDLDFETGACARHLDLTPSLSLADLETPAADLDAAFTSALVATHVSGVCLLAMPNTPRGGALVNPRSIMALLDAATSLYDHVVIDMPRHMQSWSLPVLAGADRVTVVTELTIPSLHAGRDILSRLKDMAGGCIHRQAVIGKFERRSFRNALKVSDAEAALGLQIAGKLTVDMDTTREALNCGEPAGVVRPDSRFVKDVHTLVDRLSRTSENAAIQAA